MNGFSIEDDEFIAEIPEWVEHLSVDRGDGEWCTVVRGDSHGTGDQKTVIAFADSAARAVQDAVDNAEGNRMNDDPFRDWLVERADRLTQRSDQTANGLSHRANEARFILGRYRFITGDPVHEAILTAAATDDAGTANHAGTTDTPRTDDPDDEAAYDEAAMEKYREKVRLLVSSQGALWKETVEAIAALPKPVKGRGG